MQAPRSCSYSIYCDDKELVLTFNVRLGVVSVSTSLRKTFYVHCESGLDESHFKSNFNFPFVFAVFCFHEERRQAAIA